MTKNDFSLKPRPETGNIMDNYEKQDFCCYLRSAHVKSIRFSLFR